MTASERTQLDQLGYLIWPNFMSLELLLALQRRTEELFAQEGDSAGLEFRLEPNTRRLANLIAKDEVYRQIVVMPAILHAVSAVLGPRYKLSSLNARSANPNSESLQPLHADMGLVADELGYAVCNTVWMLDDFTEQNGALRAVPNSHLWRRLPQTDMAGPNATHPGEVLITGTAGTVVVMNAHVWHGGTANRTDHPRRALHGFFCRFDKPQQQYQRQLIPKEVQSAFSPELRKVLALDDPLNDDLSAFADRPSGFLR